jgi:hypothetical protein
MAKAARRPTAAKAAPRRLPPALIDPPIAPYASLEEWLAYRASLDRLDVPSLGPHKREAAREIARLRARRE